MLISSQNVDYFNGISSEFREGKIKANDYFDRFRQLFVPLAHETQWVDVLMTMLSLLENAQRRRDLYEAYRSWVIQGKRDRISRKGKKNDRKNNKNNTAKNNNKNNSNNNNNYNNKPNKNGKRKRESSDDAAQGRDDQMDAVKHLKIPTSHNRSHDSYSDDSNNSGSEDRLIDGKTNPSFTQKMAAS